MKYFVTFFRVLQQPLNFSEVAIRYTIPSPSNISINSYQTRNMILLLTTRVKLQSADIYEHSADLSYSKKKSYRNFEKNSESDRVSSCFFYQSCLSVHSYILYFRPSLKVHLAFERYFCKHGYLNSLSCNLNCPRFGSDLRISLEVLRLNRKCQSIFLVSVPNGFSAYLYNAARRGIRRRGVIGSPGSGLYRYLSGQTS